MPYWQLHYQFVWATYNREPTIDPRIEARVYGFLAFKGVELGGKIFAINGTADHVHMVASVPPRIAIADFVGQVKGFSSYRINQEKLLARRFHWQEEYGAFSFDAKRLPNYVAYVQDQKRHHGAGTTIRVLERVEEEGVVREEPAIYAFEDPAWRRELEALTPD